MMLVIITHRFMVYLPKCMGHLWGKCWDSYSIHGAYGEILVVPLPCQIALGYRRLSYAGNIYEQICYCIQIKQTFQRKHTLAYVYIFFKNPNIS